jgi:hypothetical protein
LESEHRFPRYPPFGHPTRREAKAQKLPFPAMALLDRLVRGAIILKIKGRSYRAHGPKDGDKPA